MARKQSLIITLAFLFLAGAAIAQSNVTVDPSDFHKLTPRTLRDDAHVRSAVVGMAKASGDTTYHYGGSNRIDGKFQTATGTATWHDWEAIDFTAPNAIDPWHVSDEYVLEGSYSMVCGQDIEVPGGLEFGYGNNWRTALIFSHTVDSPSVASDLRVAGTLRIDTEPTYDFVYLQVARADGWTNIDSEAVWDGARVYNFDFSTVVYPDDYTGSSGDEIEIRFYFEADGAASDEDGDYDSDGAVWLDNILVEVDSAQADYENFEDGMAQNWTAESVPSVGNFAALYSNLQDLDPCVDNTSVQVAFIDDGVIVPGTGGTQGQTWRYGPGGYIVNNTGGLMGPDNYIENGIVSRPIEWPEGHEAAELTFGVYMHEPMTALSGGTMYVWWVRSTTSDDPNMLRFEDWDFDYTLWYGPPVYNDHDIDLTSYLAPGRKWFQVRLEVWEMGWLFGAHGTDGTPHPYFDNIRVTTYPFAGPALNNDAVYLAQDNFPEQGDVDLVNLASNSIRFDAARNISPNGDLRNDPGDSLWVDAVPVRSGSVLQQLPQMVVRMKANPVFDGVRALPAGFSQTDDIVSGIVLGDSVFTATGTLVEHRYSFDLPDTGFFYPGDVIHYYYEAWDNMGGDVGHTIMPGDTTGFASFDHDMQFPSNYICRGLPTVKSTAPGDQPKILYWNDAGFNGEDEWYFAMKGAGLTEAEDFDLYFTNAVSAGVGNGLGGRATGAVLDGYDVLLYNSGNSLAYVLGNGDFETDPSRDIQVLNSWMAYSDKKMFMMGDDLAFGLTQQGAEGLAFLTNTMGVQLEQRQIVNLINNQVAPTVVPTPGNGILTTVDEWIAYGGCLLINSFDAVETVGGGVRLAEFADPNGNTGTYPYAAAVYNHNSTVNSEVVYMPFGFRYFYNSPGYTPPPGYQGVAARSLILRDVLTSFGVSLSGPVGVEDVPEIKAMDLSVYPNPFNPSTTIELAMPRAGHASLKIFNLRGELVQTLVNGELPAGSHEMRWDGRSNSGARAASGIYFAEVRALGQTKVTRMAMVK